MKNYRMLRMRYMRRVTQAKQSRKRRGGFSYLVYCECLHVQVLLVMGKAANAAF